MARSNHYIAIVLIQFETNCCKVISNYDTIKTGRRDAVLN